MTTIQVTKKSDIQVPIQGSHRFENGNLYADDWINWYGNTPEYSITYHKKGEMYPVEYMSHCKTGRGVITKVAKFLNVK